jgi:hypothetical protein
LGTSFADVNNATTASPESVATNHDPCSYTVTTNLDSQGTYYWRIDENPGPTKGVVWTFTLADLEKAALPYPGHGATGVSAFVELSWAAGISATSHDVYLSTDFNDVNDRLITADNVTTNSYTPGSPLELDATYYWRVDEVPGSNGPVWNFTTDAHHTVDDFDAYADQWTLNPVWKDYYTNLDNGAIVLVNTDAQWALDGNSMRFDYSNGTATKGQYLGSWAEASVGDLAQIGAAWNASGAEAIVLNFFGQSANSKLDTDRLYLKLEDGSANTGMVKYPDVNALAEEQWHEWNIDLDDPNFASVSKSSISKVTLGFGGPGAIGKSGAGGTGTVYFDDFEVWPARCRTEIAYPFGDLTEDCTIDANDLRAMSVDWLITDYNTIGYNATLKNYEGEPNWLPSGGKIDGALEIAHK